MTDFTSLLQPNRGQPAHLLHLVGEDALEEWLSAQPERLRAAIAAARFTGKPGEFAILPGNKPDEWAAAIGRAKFAGPWDLAGAASKLPDGTYRLAEGEPGEAALGWLLAHHRFDRYRTEPDRIPQRVLLTGEVAQIETTARIAAAVALVRDLVDTPASDMGPAELARAAETVANECGANFKVTQGDALAQVGSSRVDLQACKLEYSIVSPK